MKVNRFLKGELARAFVVAVVFVFLGRLLRLMGASRAGIWVYRMAYRRAVEKDVKAKLANSFAAAVVRRSQSGISGTEAEKLFAEAERYLRDATGTSHEARAWLGRIVLLQGRRDEAERDLRLSLQAMDSKMARFELARLAISRHAFAEAAELIAPVPWWKSLSPDSRLLRSIVLAQAGEIGDARRWLFWASRSRSVRARSHIVRALICQAEGDFDGFSAALCVSVENGVSIDAACLGQARLSASRGQTVSRDAWISAGIERAPDNVALKLEDAMRREIPVGAVVAQISCDEDEANAIRGLLVYAARRREKNAVLDRIVRERVNPGLDEAAGDYAYATGDSVTAVRLWCRAGAESNSARARAAFRAQVVSEECLSLENFDAAHRIAVLTQLDEEVRDEASRRAAFAFLSAAREGRRCVAPDKVESTVPARVRALIRLLGGSVAAARAELGGILRKGTDPIGEVLSGRFEQVADVAHYREAATRRREKSEQDVRSFREALAEKRWEAAAAFLGRVSWRFPSLSEGAEASELLIGVLAGRAYSINDLEEIAAAFPSDRVRALARHDVAVEIERERQAGQRAWSGWRRWATVWDEALAQKAYATFVNARAVILDDPRVGHEGSSAIFESALVRLVAVFRPWLELESRRRSVADEVARSPVAKRTAEAIALELFPVLEHANENAQLKPRTGSDGAQQSPVDSWRHDVDAIVNGHAQLDNLGVFAERVSGLSERSSRTLINLAVDLNAAGNSDDAIHLTEAALKLARAPADIALCEKNIAAYRSAHK